MEEEEEEEEEDEEILNYLSSLLSSFSSSSSSEHLTSSLQRLIQASLSPHSRRLLALPPFLALLPHSPPPLHNLQSLSLLLKLLRNLCARDPPNQLAFLDSDGVDAVAAIVCSLAPLCSALPLASNSGFETLRICECSSDSPSEGNVINGHVVDVLQMAMQLLGNFSGGGEAHREAVWRRFFPDSFFLLVMTDEEKILDPVLMLLYTCTRNNKDRLAALCNEQRTALFATCLRTAASYSVESRSRQWMHLLVSELCLSHPFFPSIFASLEDPKHPATLATDDLHCAGADAFSVEQAALLEIIGSVLVEKNEDKRSGEIDDHKNECFPMPAESLSYLIDIIKRVSSCLGPDCKSTKDLPVGIPSIDVLGHALQVVKILSAWECGTYEQVDISDEMHRKHGGNEGSCVMALLTSQGLMSLCIDYLQELGPPELIGRTMQQEDGPNLSPGPSGGATGAEIELPMLKVSEERGSPVVRAPYRGYRRDLVAIIGNASHQNKSVQDEVRQKGGLLLMLHHCVTDKDNPFLREWGFWAMRNLLEGNEDNCKELIDMELKGFSTTSELASMGLKVEINSQTGRPRLVNASF